MSSTTLISREVGPDGISRYRTRYKVLVHSHNNTNGVIDLGNSVVRVSSNKNIKSVGSLTLTLVGDRNMLNLVYPNDHINVYVDRADGQGWTRLFYGFIDQLEESYSAGPPPSTLYSIQCSDFSKAPERTQIYFNPHVASRADFRGGFIGTPNLGGMSLMTRGILMNGSPPDMVTNVMLLLMGFGSQFILPTSYNPRLMNLVRQQRADFILNRLSEDARRQVLYAGGYADFLEKIRQQTGATAPVSELTDPDGTTASDVQDAERARFSREAIARLGGTGSGVGEQGVRLGTERGIEAYNALNTTLAGYPPTLLDVLDIFTFVEREAMDGFYTGASMWERQGNVTSFLRYITNEIVNELFFDLRPVSRGGGLVMGTDYSRDLDEIEGNAGRDGVPNGVQYAPALVMREYPFSTVDRIDGAGIPLRTMGSASEVNLGLIHFGAIFSDQPCVPGRHIVTIPNINPGDLAQGRSDIVGAKHLDVAVVYDNEIISTKFMRSDSDHHNLLEIISDAMVGQAGRFYMQDLLPIITPVHIVRHGLRVRSLQTRAARFPPEVTNRLQQQPTEQEREESQPQAPEPVVEPSGVTVLPVDLAGTEGAYSQGFVTLANQWWYRPKEFDGRRPVHNVRGNPVPASGVRYWRFHNGVDVKATRGTPVKAVRDGRVVLAAPQGTKGRGGYGNVVVIYHEQDNLYSLYAHLQGFAPNLQITSRSRRLRDYAASEFMSGGRFTPVTVRAGDVIGYAGDTDSPGAVHLHFEFNVPRNGRCFPSSADRTSLTPDVFRDASTALAGYQLSGSKPSNPDENQTISQDPIRVMQTFGVVWPVQRDLNLRPPAAPDDDPTQAEMYPGDEAEDATDQDHQVAPTPTEASTAPDVTATQVTQAGFVDTPDVRRQIARWALLNDHWYQHNLEYISGTIEMRGAPEIRVGYRLDLIDRNMSFYVEGVSHNWSYGKPMTTTLHVTRGQPNNPYPSYVMPYINGFDPTETQRQTGSRLAQYFVIPDPIAVRRGLKLERTRRDSPGISALPVSARASALVNEVDMPNEGGTLKERYDEQILPAVSISIPLDMAEELEREQQALGLRGAGASLSTAQTNPQGGISDDVVSEMFPGTDLDSL